MNIVVNQKEYLLLRKLEKKMAKAFRANSKVDDVLWELHDLRKALEETLPASKTELIMSTVAKE